MLFSRHLPNSRGGKGRARSGRREEAGREAGSGPGGGGEAEGTHSDREGARLPGEEPFGLLKS